MRPTRALDIAIGLVEERFYASRTREDHEALQLLRMMRREEDETGTFETCDLHRLLRASVASQGGA